MEKKSFMEEKNLNTTAEETLETTESEVEAEPQQKQERPEVEGILEIQEEGGKRLSARDFLNGRKLKVGDLLTKEKC